MKNKLKKSIVSLLCASILTIGVSSPVHAETMETASQFTAIDGTVYDYFLDEVGNPYIIINDEVTYVALPLDHLKVTDSEKIAELNECILPVQTRSLPTNYYDISEGDAEVINSPVYTASVDFDATTTFTTRVLKVNRRHVQFRFKTSNIKKENILTGSKVNFTVYFYDVVAEEWFAETYNEVNCTSTNGVGIVFSPTVTEYLQFDVSKSSKIKSLTLEIWTTGLW